MVKMFALEDGRAYVLVGEDWHACSVGPDSVAVQGKAKVAPLECFTLDEIRAKTAGMPEQDDSGPRGRKNRAEKEPEEEEG